MGHAPDSLAGTTVPGSCDSGQARYRIVTRKAIDRMTTPADNPALDTPDILATDKRTISEEFHGPLAGDSKDDDGAILDDFFKANPNPPNPEPTRPVYPAWDLDDHRPKVSRILSKTFLIDPSEPAVQLFPADPNRRSLRVLALQRAAVVQIANPAAGTDWSYQVPQGKRVRLGNLEALLTTSAVAGTRIIAFQILDNNGNIVYAIDASNNQVAATARRQGFGNQGPNVSVALLNSVIPSLRDFVIPEFWTIRAVTTAMDVGDQWSSIFLTDDGSQSVIRIASESNEVNSAAKWPVGIEFCTDKHTGAVWVGCPDSLGKMEITAETVTE